MTEERKPVVHVPGELGRRTLCNDPQPGDGYYEPLEGWRSMPNPEFLTEMQQINCDDCIRVVEEHFDDEKPDHPPRVASCGTCVHHADDGTCYANPPQLVALPQIDGQPWQAPVEWRPKTGNSEPPCVHWRPTK